MGHFLDMTQRLDTSSRCSLSDIREVVGNPVGFESPLRDPRNIQREFGLAPRYMFHTCVGGNRGLLRDYAFPQDGADGGTRLCRRRGSRGVVRFRQPPCWLFSFSFGRISS